MEFIENHLAETTKILNSLSRETISQAIDLLVSVRENGGRLFILGVGGSAGNASHAVNDFRKLTDIESYAPTDNVSELTARINDDGWDSVFVNWLRVSRFNSKDAMLILSVGGGDDKLNLSTNLISALKLANELSAKSVAIVGREEGFAAQNATVAIVIPKVNDSSITAHSESLQAVIWHLMVNHPKLNTSKAKWESFDK